MRKKAKNILITVCGRAGSKGFKNKNLKIFCGKPLSHYTMSAIEIFIKERADLSIDVVLNTDSQLLKDTICDKYPWVEFIERPEELCGDTVAKMSVFQHSLKYMEKKYKTRYDYLVDLDITSPLRTASDLAACFVAKENRADLDLVMSAAPSRRSPYMNMAQCEGDHVAQVIKTTFVARQQTPTCYDINASIYVFSRDFLAENKSGFLWDGKCDIYEMMDTGILDIDSEEDFLLMEAIAGHLYHVYPDFSRVQNNIK